MPRTARASAGDLCYHILNRGNARAAVFHKDRDHQAFLALIPAASDRPPMRVLGFRPMPKPLHVILRPHEDGTSFARDAAAQAPARSAASQRRF